MLELIVRAIPVQRGLQPENISYLASFTFEDIARLLDDDRLYVPHQSDLPDLAQRKPNPARVKAIAQYILDTYSEGTTFFPPICINVQPAPMYENGCILLPYNSVTLRLTDGQHRCFGIRQALKTLQIERSLQVLDLGQLEMGVLLYAGLSLENERQAFRDQNLLVQKPSVSLSHYFDRTTPIVVLSKALLECVPYFSNNVEIVENGLGNHNPKLLTLSTLVSANKHLFPHLKSKENLQPKINWAAAFWNTAANNLPNDPWQQIPKEERRQQRQEFLNVHAVFFQALGMLARDLYLENISQEELHKWLIRLQEIDWRRENELWRDRSVVQISSTDRLIISNTKTTIRAFHRVLQEFIGILPTNSALRQTL